MASVMIPKRLWDGSLPMPKVCIACGKPATSEAVIKTKLESSPVVGATHDTSALGCLFSALELFSLGRNVAARESRLCLDVPVCRYHRWVAPPSVTIEADDAETVTLSGVCAEFMALLPHESATD